MRLLNAAILASNAARQLHADSGKPRSLHLYFVKRSMSESIAMLPQV